MSFLIGRSRPGSYTRVCDVCGRLRPPPFRQVDGLHICDMHPGFVPRSLLEKIQYREIVPEPIPHPKPNAPRDTHEAAEAEILMLAAYAPDDVFDVTAGPMPASAPDTFQAAAWAAIYLYHLIVEDQRPGHWITFATSLLRSLATWLYENQHAGPAGAGGRTSDDIRWGSYNRGTVQQEDFYVEDSGAAGLALLRAYQLLGDSRYLDGARACAWFVRSMQCGDLLVSRPSSTDSAGSSVKHWGMWSHRFVLAAAYDFDHRYYPSDLVCLEFLHLFKTVAGDETIGSVTPDGNYTGSRAAAVSTCIAEARAFWESAVWSVDDGAAIKGLSTATPREYFDSYPANKGAFTGRGSWQYQDGPLATGTLITGASWAMGIRAFHSIDGASATVTGLFDWLMGFTSNSTYELPEDYDARLLWGGAKGEYDPKVALSTLLLVRDGTPLAAVTKNGSSFYDLTTTGLLAALYATRQAATFKATKSALNDRRPRSREGTDNDNAMPLYLGQLGYCGLSYQPFTDASLNRKKSVTRASQVGLVYRQSPKAFMGRPD